ncbi:MAG: non-hydrolyzing UDP-N-acetylglucosamine 2-epimerase [Desulfatiglandales bacterium]
MIIHLIAAARPNFMKIAPLYHALKREDWAHPVIVHTGQHYDMNMSDSFFEDFSLPAPDIHLGVGSGTHAEQTGRVLMRYEGVLFEKRPDLVVVVGDVNSTMAATIAATKLGILVAHLEAGLRSFDRSMPEEINRLVTDALADILWTPSPDADENLIKEGIPQHRIQRVGNIMIDSLELMREKINAASMTNHLGLEPGKYGLVTLHRPSNVDDPEKLRSICDLLAKVGREIDLVFPVHPRTRKNLEKAGLAPVLEKASGVHCVEPMRYIPFMNLVFNGRFVITDSGGIQEETTYLGIPCMTLRPNTERPITIHQGTNRLCTLEDIEEKLRKALNGRAGEHRPPEFWDGRTAGRVVESIRSIDRTEIV